LGKDGVSEPVSPDRLKGIAHDLRNLLMVIINYAQFVSQTFEDRPEVQADLSEIVKAAQDITHLTEQLREMERP
jgi:signal transduction histidine kinase